MKKRLIAGFLTLTMALGQLINVNAATISIDGLKQIVSTNIINEEGYNLLELRAVFEMLGAQVSWNSDKKQATAVKDDITIVLSTRTSLATINGKEVGLPIDCQIVDDKIYIPIRFVAEALNYDIDWNGTSQTISIKTVTDDEYILLKTESPITSETTIYTYEQALELATKKSSSLKSIDDSVSYLEDLRDQLYDTREALDKYDYFLYSEILDEGNDSSALDTLKNTMADNLENIISVSRSIKTLDLQQGMIDTNKEMVKDGIEVSLISQLNSIKQLEAQISILEASIELSERQVSELTLKNELGYASDYELETAVNNLATSKNSLDSLYLSLDNCKIALNMFLGLSADADIAVDYNSSVKSLDDFKLESFITKQREAAPTIKILKNALTSAKYAEQTNSGMTSELSVSVENAVKDADRALSDGKDSLEENIRSAYNNINQLVKQDKSLKVAVNQAITDYNSVVTSYQAGMATETQVMQAKLGVLAAEKAVEDNLLQYNILVYMFEKPYLLG